MQEENLWAISIEENGTSHELFLMELEKYPDPSIFLAKTPNTSKSSKNQEFFFGKKTSKLQAFSKNPE